MSGLRDMGEFSFSGHWDAAAMPAIDASQRVVLYPSSVRVFGVDLWLERMVFQARVVSTHDELGVTGATYQPTTPVVVERAEWWRRWLYHALWRPAVWANRRQA